MVVHMVRRWLQQVQMSLRGHTAPARRSRPGRKPWMEALEDRLSPATVQFGLASESLLETAGTFTIPVKLSAPVNTDVTVPFTLGGTAVAGTDFTGVIASPLVIPAGQLANNITGTLVDDGAPDASKTIMLTLGAPTGATLGATTSNTLTIGETPASPTTLSIGNASVTEPAAPGAPVNLTFTVTRTGDLTSQLTVGYTTVAGTAQAGTDFTPTTGTTMFASGSATATINIPVFGNGVFNNPNQSFSVQLTGVTNVVGPPVTFGSRTNFPALASPIRMAVGDLNGDGKPDLVFASYGANTVSVLLNTTTPGATTPTFANRIDLQTGTHPFGLALGDFNSDGLQDIAVTNFGDDTVSVFLNNPAAPGTFAAPQTFATGSFPNGLAVADVNGDGKPDLVVTNENAATVSVLVNNTAPGNATLAFPTKVDFSTGTNAGSTKPVGVAIGDLNGDGKPDLAVANYGNNTVSVLLNMTPTGSAMPSFTTHQDFATGTKPVAVVVGDLNGDGLPDLAVANQGSASVSVFINSTAPGAATPSFAAQQTFSVGTSVGFGMALGDVNGDGKPDLVVTNAGDDTASVLLNTAAPGAAAASFANQQTFATGSFPSAVALGDFNGDGKPDLAVANRAGPSVSVLLNTTMLGAATIPPDLPTAGATTIVGSGPISVATGDFNGDGKPDLVVANENDNTVAVQLNTTTPGGAPSFAAPQTFQTDKAPFAVAVGDLNGDGKPDIVVANYSSGTVSVLLNNTAAGASMPVFTTPKSFTVGTGPDSIALADVIHDGLPDIVVANLTDGTISVLRNTTAAGSLTPAFAAQQIIGVGNSPVGLTAADLNGDGLPDLVVANELDSTVTVLLNQTTPPATTAAFSAPKTFGTGSNPDAVAVGDLNGDGLPDLVVANGNGDSVSVLLNMVATPGSFASQQTFATGASPDALTVGDINGDGKPDLVVANANDNTLSLLLNTTTPNATSFAPQQTFATGQLPHSVALSDLNGDGRPDVVVANFTDNTAPVLVNTPVEITGNTGTGTITESDAPPTVQFSAASEILNEGSNFSITVTLSAASGAATTIPFTLGGSAVNGTDFTNVTGSPLEIPAGQTSATITGMLLDDGAPDAGKTLTFTLGTPTNATLGNATINTLTIGEPNPTVQFSAASENVSETAGTFSVTVTLSAATASDVSVPFTFGGSAVSGTDFSGITASPLVIAAGQTSGTITGNILDDNLFDTTDRTLTFTLGTPTNATLGATTVNTLTINEDNDTPPVATFGTEVQNGATFSLPITLSAASEVTTTIPFTIGGTASVSNATPSPLVIAAGQTSGTITGTFSDGGFGGSSQTVTVTMQTPTNATTGPPNPVTFTEATPTVQFAAASESVSETAGTFTITVTQSAAAPNDTSVPFTLGGTAVAGTDFSNVTTSPLVIQAGQTSATITGTLLDDNLFDPTNRTMVFTLGTPTNATLGATTVNTLTITEDNDTPPVATFGTETQNGATFSLPVTLSSASEVSTTIPFTIGGTASVSNVTASPLVIAAGQMGGIITGTFTDGGFGGSSQTVTVTMGTPTNATAGTPNPVTFTEATPTVQFSVASESVSETAGTFTITVTQSAAAPNDTSVPFTIGGTAVTGTDFRNVTSSPLLIPAGQTSATITGTLLDDNLFDPTNRTMVFTLGTPTNATLGATTVNTLTITEDNDTPPVATFGTETQNGATFSLPVTLSAASEVATTIPFTIGGTASVSNVTASPLVIPAGRMSGIITGTFTDGGFGGSSQTVNVTMGTPTNAAAGTPNPVTFTESTPTVQFSVASESVSETAGTFTITVTQSAAAPTNTTVPFTIGGTAVAATDYSGVTASPLVIPAGQTSATITGTVVDDDLFDTTNRTITFTLGTPTNATLGATKVNTLTISEDNDTPPTVQFSTASESVSETAGSFSITVALSGPSEVATTVPFTLGGSAVAGTDFTNVTGSPLIIPAGQTSGTITGTLIDDGAPDANKTLTFTLGNPINATLGATTTNTLSIAEAVVPTVQFSAASESLAETAGSFSLTVTLSAATDADVSVPFTLGGTAVPGTDFSGVTASPLVIPAGQTSGTIKGTLLDDGAPDAVKTLTFTLGTPTNATLGSTATNTLTITEAPPTVQFSTDSESFAETAGNFSVTVTLSAASSADVSVPFTLGGSAVAGTDFSGVTASPLVIPAGQTSGSIKGTLLDDGAPDAVKTLTFTLGTPTNAALGATTTNTLTITEAAAPPTVQFSTASESFAETAGNFSITVALSAASASDVSVPFTLGGTAVAGTDFNGVTASPLVIPAGQTSGTIKGTLLDDGTPDAVKTLTFTLGTPTNATLGTTTTNTLTITEPAAGPPTVQFSAASESLAETGGSFSITVSLSAATSADVSVPFTLGGTAVAGTDFMGVTASPLVIKAGQTSGAITGTLLDDGAPDAVKTLSFTLGTPTNATLGSTTTNTLTITEAAAPPTVQFSAASESFTETAGTFSVTVTLSAAAGQDVSVPFTLGGTAVAGTDFSGVTASPLVIPAGQTSGTLSGTLLDDNLFDPNNRTLTFTLGTPTNATLGSTATNTLTITEDDDDGTPAVQLGALNINGTTFTVPVILSAPSEIDTIVPFTLGGTAGLSNVTPSPLVIPAGQTVGIITGTFTDGGQGGPSQTLSVSLATPTGATLNAAQAKVTVAEPAAPTPTTTPTPTATPTPTPTPTIFTFPTIRHVGVLPLQVTLHSAMALEYHVRHGTRVIVPTNRDLQRAVKDPNHRLVRFVLVKGPSAGKLKFHSDGSFRLTLPPDFSGVLSMVVRATDGLATSPNLTVRFVVA